jgi:hypothetical protein
MSFMGRETLNDFEMTIEFMHRAIALAWWD